MKYLKKTRSDDLVLTNLNVLYKQVILREIALSRLIKSSVLIKYIDGHFVAQI